MKKYRQVIKFIATFSTTLYVIFLYKAVTGQVNLSASLLSTLPSFMRDFDVLVYAGAVPLVLLWVLVLRATHLSEDDKVIRQLQRARDKGRD